MFDQNTKVNDNNNKTSTSNIGATSKARKQRETFVFRSRKKFRSPICAMASKSYGWDVRNIAIISPKMSKKQSFFDFFQFSQKLSIRVERKFVQSFYTLLWSFVCNFITIVLLGCEKHSQN